jgi:hypothetical protein
MGALKRWSTGERFKTLVIQRWIGEGVEGQVYLVRDRRDGGLKAWKIIKDADMVEEIRHTVQHWQQFAGLAQCRPILEWGVILDPSCAAERPWLLSPWIPGDTLREAIKRGHIRDPVALVISLLKVLEPIHQRGLGIGDFDHGRNIIIELRTGKFVFIDMDAGGPNHDPPAIYEDLHEVLGLAKKCAGTKLSAPMVKVLKDSPDAEFALRWIANEGYL